MSSLDGFRSMDFMEQIAALADVERAADPAAIPALLDLFRKPVGDPAVDTMLRKALQALLTAHPDALLEAMTQGTDALKVFCVNLAGDRKLQGAVPALLTLAQERADDPDILQDCLAALARIDDPAALPLFRRHMTHEDDFLAALCIEQLGVYKDPEALPGLRAIVEANEAPDRYAQCDVTTWRAIEALAALESEPALAFLAAKLHHANPTARRMVHRALVDAGDRAVPLVGAVLNTSQDSDERIMAANVLGFIGSRQGADLLIAALDEGRLREPNEFFAVYEALGRIPGMKSLVCLKDALWREHDALLLLAVVKGLEQLCSPAMAQGLAREVATKAQAHPETLTPLLRAVVAAEAATLFAALYALPELDKSLGALAVQSATAPALERFVEALNGLGNSPAAAGLLAALQGRAAQSAAAPHLLAVDDSGAMRSFYTQAGGELGLRVTTAENGRQALDLVEQGTHFDFLVVDMNMPVMDGIELTTKLRALPGWERTPILMASTESAKAQAQLAREAGVDGFIVKPFTLDVFKNRIAKMQRSS